MPSDLCVGTARRVGGAVAVILAAGMLLAEADPAAAGPRRDTYLRLSVQPDGGEAVGTAGLGTAWLRCGPARGTVRDPAAACAAIRAARGDLTALPVDEDTMCTMQYQPVTATAKGRWRGRPVRYRETFPNGCVLHVHTGPVFTF